MVGKSQKKIDPNKYNGKKYYYAYKRIDGVAQRIECKSKTELIKQIKNRVKNSFDYLTQEQKKDMYNAMKMINLDTYGKTPFSDLAELTKDFSRSELIDAHNALSLLRKLQEIESNNGKYRKTTLYEIVKTYHEKNYPNVISVSLDELEKRKLANKFREFIEKYGYSLEYSNEKAIYRLIEKGLKPHKTRNAIKLQEALERVLGKTIIKRIHSKYRTPQEIKKIVREIINQNVASDLFKRTRKEKL